MCHGVGSDVCLGVGNILNSWVSGSLVLVLKPVAGFKTVSRHVTRVVLVCHHFMHPDDIGLKHDIIWMTM